MKILIISHRSDPDGVTPVILSKLVFDEVDYILTESSEVNNKVLDLINNTDLDIYNNIYITDLGLNEELNSIIDNNLKLKDKIRVFDHHLGNMHGNKYSFVKVVFEDEKGKKQCGTSLYYDYLCENYDNLYLKKDAVKTFVNHVREYDIWEWKETNNIDAKRLSDLFDFFGKDYFLEYYLKFLKENDKFYFNEQELFILEMINRQVTNFIEEKKKNVIPIKINCIRAGLVFSSLYRSELGNALAIHYEQEFDFIIIVNIERGISYRGIKNVDLNEIASMFGGKGHFSSSGSPLPNDIHEIIIKELFKDKVIIDNNI